MRIVQPLTSPCGWHCIIQPLSLDTGLLQADHECATMCSGLYHRRQNRSVEDCALADHRKQVLSILTMTCTGFLYCRATSGRALMSRLLLSQQIMNECMSKRTDFHECLFCQTVPVSMLPLFSWY